MASEAWTYFEFGQYKLLARNCFLVVVVAANRKVNFLVLWGVQTEHVHNFDKTWASLSIVVQKNEIW